MAERRRGAAALRPAAARRPAGRERGREDRRRAHRGRETPDRPPAAANRDPRQYDRPDELHLDRVDPRPISFGHGIHHCLGAALARMQMRIGLRVFLERFGEYEIDDEAIEWKVHPALRGPIVLPVSRPCR
ncbi:MAG: cytochrome P450 [Acidimicrobiales bacterium]